MSTVENPLSIRVGDEVQTSVSIKRSVILRATTEDIDVTHILENNDGEEFLRGLGDITPEDIVFKTGRRWTLVEIQNGLLKDNTGIPGCLLVDQDYRDKYFRSLEAEYNKPPVILEP